MLDLQKLLDTYAALKAHDNEIMARRPDSAPRGAWREENPAPVSASFRIVRDGKSLMARMNYDTAPELMISPLKGGRFRDRIDLRAADAGERLSEYDLPAPDNMVDFEFAAIRRRIGLTQPQLAPLIGLGSVSRVSEYERGARSIPGNIARLMNAYGDDYKPTDWPA